VGFAFVGIRRRSAGAVECRVQAFSYMNVSLILMAYIRSLGHSYSDASPYLFSLQQKILQCKAILPTKLWRLLTRLHLQQWDINYSHRVEQSPVSDYEMCLLSGSPVM